jgi:hypothetical protein
LKALFALEALFKNKIMCRGGGVQILKFGLNLQKMLGEGGQKVKKDKKNVILNLKSEIFFIYFYICIWYRGYFIFFK